MIGKVRNWFGLLPRHARHLRQKFTRGFSDADLWNLDHTIAKFVWPRLEAFRKANPVYPGCEGMETKANWAAALDDMAFALRMLAEEWDWEIKGTREDWERCHRGLRLFGEWFRALWW